MSKSSAVPECRHILTSGRKCRAIALRDRPFCYQHSRQRTLAADGSYKFVKLPPFEDHASILLALNQVTRAMTSGRIDDKVAGRCLYAIQLAMQTIRHLESQPPIEQVTDYLPGRFGDTVAVNDQPRTPEDLYYLLSEHEKSHSSHGDHGWEPTNADYEPEHRGEVELVPADDATPSKSGCHPEQARSASEGSAVALQAAGPDDKPSAEPNPTPEEPSTSGPVSGVRPGVTRENSPGRESRVPDSKPEVP